LFGSDLVTSSTSDSIARVSAKLFASSISGKKLFGNTPAVASVSSTTCGGLFGSSTFTTSPVAASALIGCIKPVDSAKSGSDLFGEPRSAGFSTSGNNVFGQPQAFPSSASNGGIFGNLATVRH
jgi:hypothetical protein